MHQISLTKAKGIRVILFRSVIVGDGVSKTVGGGLNACYEKSLKAIIWPMKQVDGVLIHTRM